jgi:UDP-N-acetylmuramoyl-tripeptide--D-alanyl-D-alanine ligase
MTIIELHKLFLQHSTVCTDTRNIKSGSLFFALKGDNFNGNSFAKNAIDQGCAYAIVDEEIEYHPNIIKVDNVLQTLQKLATYHRTYLNIPVIGITGSNGKTTTKELVFTVLKKRFKTYATHGNLNNHIGVPLSLLSLTHEHEMAVIEMGANHQGEIEMLSNICLPNYGLITNIGKAHLEGFGGEEGVIKGKSELYKHIRKSNGLLFINDDDDLLKRLSRGIDSYTYGTNSNANVYGMLKNESPNIDFDLHFNDEILNINATLSGKYNFYNMMAAAAIGLYFSVKINDITDALGKYESDNNRSQTIKTAKNTLMLDAYNANPSSMLAAITNFSSSKSNNKIAIIGGMNELGETTEEEHITLVNLLLSKDFKTVMLVGNHFNNISNAETLKFENVEAVIQYLSNNKFNDAHILIKGSRSNQLEKLVPFL